MTNQPSKSTKSPHTGANQQGLTITTEQMLNYLADAGEILNLTLVESVGWFNTDHKRAILEAIRAALLERDELKAEVVDLKDRVSTLVEIRDEFEEMCEKAEAALEQARPLLDAAKGLKWWLHKDGKTQLVDIDAQARLMEAALAYRAAKEGK